MWWKERYVCMDVEYWTLSSSTTIPFRNLVQSWQPFQKSLTPKLLALHSPFLPILSSTRPTSRPSRARRQQRLCHRHYWRSSKLTSPQGQCHPYDFFLLILPTTNALFCTSIRSVSHLQISNTFHRLHKRPNSKKSVFSEDCENGQTRMDVYLT